MFIELCGSSAKSGSTKVPSTLLQTSSPSPTCWISNRNTEAPAGTAFPIQSYRHSTEAACTRRSCAATGPWPVCRSPSHTVASGDACGQRPRHTNTIRYPRSERSDAPRHSRQDHNPRRSACESCQSNVPRRRTCVARFPDGS